MPPHTDSPRKRTIGKSAAGHLAVALLVMAAAAFSAVAWPRTPPTVRTAPLPAAWAAWTLSLAYLTALFAWHLRLGLDAARRPEAVERRAALRALVPLPVVVTSAWIAALGLDAKVLLAGLGDTVTALLAASALSSLWLIAAPVLARSTSAGRSIGRPHNRLGLWLAVACLLAGVGAASALAWLEWNGATSTG